ncbi:hypothetical protein GFL91_28685 [Rhizobium leguminosarum bv. viciae]|uniref:Uncharacterized protein n=1 Tax=Rhizobium leguminosarum bv. viciae TaxID=387 RepID=A0A8I2GVT3_RHILV|nr:hypothetical protein [Rhizobium leguminosarum]MBY5416513.1 hypothetical protein [Rhizobium leguminosarum]NEH49829.1 hypothetical protein [Rhizobium leguminosarum]NEH57643.1 hypothetical protein [Rhizobium leguminosarum]NKM48851.1 hypothetical protein [Rhizobium leguminosarum bv. viciae]
MTVMTSRHCELPTAAKFQMQHPLQPWTRTRNAATRVCYPQLIAIYGNWRRCRESEHLITASYLKRKVRSINIFRGCISRLSNLSGLGFAGPAALYFSPYYPLPQDLVSGDFDGYDTVADEEIPVLPPK